MNNPNSIEPPKWPLRFLRWFCSPELLEDVEGDLVELYSQNSTQHPQSANWRFYGDVLLLFRPGVIRNFPIRQQRFIMFNNHLTTAYRHALKSKWYTGLNLLGMITGLACAMLIFLWVSDETSKNAFHENDIHRLCRNMYQSSGEIQTTRAIPQPLAEVLKSEYPEVEHVSLMSWNHEMLFQYEDETSYEYGFFVSDEFFELFSYELLIGDPRTVLDDMHGVVISRTVAENYFNDVGNAMGKMFTIDNRQEFQVTGVFEDPSEESSYTFDWVVNAEEFISRNDWVESWYNGGFGMYFSIREDADIAAVSARLEHEINNHTTDGSDERLFTMPLEDVYLYTEFEDGKVAGGRIMYVRILSGIAVFLLLMACINFTNLATARSTRRSREIGVRKVLGAQRGTLRSQFFTESFLMATVATVLALLVVLLTLPLFNELTGKELVISFMDPAVWVALVGIVFFVGILSGIYPAILLPRFQAIESIKGLVKGTAFNLGLRNALVVFQFALAIVLIVGTFVVSGQIDYILNKNLGLDKENVVYFDLSDEALEMGEAYREELLKIPEVKSVTFSSGNPLSYGRSTSTAAWDGKDPDAVVEINVMITDPWFFKTMNMTLAAGREFDPELATDTSSFIINQVAADIMGFDDPIDQSLSIWGIEGRVIGVVNNFHMSSMYDPIEPLIIANFPSDTEITFVRIQNNIPAAVEKLEDLEARINPEFPFRYSFMDEEYRNNYENEMAVGSMVRIFAMMAILISCLGLLGLASYNADQRTREIGIRKVHGASTFQLVYLLSRDFGKLILVAFIVAAPVSIFLSREWLGNFNFHLELNVFTILIAGVLALVVGSVTVGLKSMQAALTNPVDSLSENE